MGYEDEAGSGDVVTNEFEERLRLSQSGAVGFVHHEDLRFVGEGSGDLKHLQASNGEAGTRRSG